MTEDGIQKEIPFEEWQGMMADGVAETLDNFELFDEQINFDPATLISDQDDRTWRQLNEKERQWLIDEISRAYGFNRRNEVKLNSYTIEAPKADDVTWKGKAKVNVFETHRTKLSNMAFHEITWPEGDVEIVIAPKDAEIGNNNR